MGLLLSTLLALLAFAGNSLLCRVALRDTGIDAASFTALRIASGAVMLAAIAWARARRDGSGPALTGSWASAGALFTYAAAFSLAYVELSTGTGALLLFGAVQLSMTAWGLWQGERLQATQWAGLALALSGLVALLLPGLAAPPPAAAALMMGAGVAWGIYSLRGRRAGDPTRATAGNFCRAVPMALALWAAAGAWQGWHVEPTGAGYAVASGALASGLGYALWYAVLPRLRAATAATSQLAVPALAAAGGAVLLGEPLSWRLALSSAVLLGGIALVIRTGTARPAFR